LLWSYTLEKHVLATPAISAGLLFIADCGRKMHCSMPQPGGCMDPRYLLVKCGLRRWWPTGKGLSRYAFGEVPNLRSFGHEAGADQGGFRQPHQRHHHRRPGVFHVATMRDLFAIGTAPAKN
jgi:hypothetical protein